MIDSPQTCPNCGAELPPRAKACPACGSDEQTGWSQEAELSHLGLPDDSFDYEQFAQREFGKKKILPYGIGFLWWLIALFLLALFISAFFWPLR